MEPSNRNADAKPKYETPKVLASYEKEELEALIRPEGQGSPGCGCGA